MELEGIIMLTHIHFDTIKCKKKYKKKNHFDPSTCCMENKLQKSMI